MVLNTESSWVLQGGDKAYSRKGMQLWEQPRELKFRISLQKRMGCEASQDEDGLGKRLKKTCTCQIQVTAIDCVYWCRNFREWFVVSLWPIWLLFSRIPHVVKWDFASVLGTGHVIPLFSLGLPWSKADSMEGQGKWGRETNWQSFLKKVRITGNLSGKLHKAIFPGVLVLPVLSQCAAWMGAEGFRRCQPCFQLSCAPRSAACQGLLWCLQKREYKRTAHAKQTQFGPWNSQGGYAYFMCLSCIFHFDACLHWILINVFTYFFWQVTCSHEYY